MLSWGSFCTPIRGHVWKPIDMQGEEVQNFGDFLTTFLYDSLAAGIRIRGDGYRLLGSAISDRIVRDDLCRLGEWENGRIVFWCCGLRDENPLQPVSLARSVFCGVRGPLTRAALGLPLSTPLGDPALLLPAIYNTRESLRTKGKTICVPHFQDKLSDEKLLAMTGADIIVRPSIPASAEALTEIIDDIASASFVLAGSLHAAIVACAYEVPFCYFDSGWVDIPFKWRDFSASINIGTYFVRTLVEGRKTYETLMLPALRKPPLFPILAATPFCVETAKFLMVARYDSERTDSGFGMDKEAFSRLAGWIDYDFALAQSNSVADWNFEALTEVNAELEQRLSRSQATIAELEQRLSRSQVTITELDQQLSGAQGKRCAVTGLRHMPRA